LVEVRAGVSAPTARAMLWAITARFSQDASAANLPLGNCQPGGLQLGDRLLDDRVSAVVDLDLDLTAPVGDDGVVVPVGVQPTRERHPQQRRNDASPATSRTKGSRSTPRPRLVPLLHPVGGNSALDPPVPAADPRLAIDAFDHFGGSDLA